MPWGRHPLRGGQRGLVLGAENRALLLREALQQIGGPLGGVQPAEVLADGQRPLPERWLVAQPLHRARDLPGGQGGARLDLIGKFVMG
jgi:hypothetical protein